MPPLNDIVMPNVHPEIQRLRYNNYYHYPGIPGALALKGLIYCRQILDITLEHRRPVTGAFFCLYAGIVQELF